MVHGDHNHLVECLFTAYTTYIKKRPVLSDTSYVEFGDITASYNGRNFVLYLSAERECPVLRGIKPTVVCSSTTRRGWSIPYNNRRRHPEDRGSKELS